MAGAARRLQPRRSRRRRPAAAGPVKVALLLPLSGANAELGKAMLEAAQLALFTTGSDRLTLVPRDTSGTADGAANAARAAIADGAQLILGPLLAAEVEAVKPIARDAHVNVIAFSTETQLAGGNVFLMGFLPRQEVAREVGYRARAGPRAIRRAGAEFALRPADGAMRCARRRRRERRARSPRSSISIRAPAMSPPAIKRLLRGSGAAAAAGAHCGAAAAPFDALLLPEGGDQLKQIARQLKAAGIEHASGAAARQRVVGRSRSSATSRRWSAAGSPPRRPRRGSDFESRFQAAYGHPPPRLASLAFDAAALAAVLAQGRRPRAVFAAGDPRTRAGSPASTACSASRRTGWCSAASPCSRSRAAAAPSRGQPGAAEASRMLGVV